MTMSCDDIDGFEVKEGSLKVSAHILESSLRYFLSHKKQKSVYCNDKEQGAFSSDYDPNCTQLLIQKVTETIGGYDEEFIKITIICGRSTKCTEKEIIEKALAEDNNDNQR